MGLVLAEAVLIGALGGALGPVPGRPHDPRPSPPPCIGDAVRGFPNLGLSPLVGGARLRAWPSSSASSPASCPP